MHETSRLCKILQPHLRWHRARLTFAASFILAVIKVRTVTFDQLALVLNPRAKPDSNVRRIQRFFAQFSFDAATFGRLMLVLLPQKDGLVVTIDRTHWKLGSVDLNILMFSVAHKGIAFPVVWTLLGKAGNSNCNERKLLLRRFLELVESDDICAVVADREFIGEGWFADLKAASLPFYIRIKHNARVGSRGRTRHARHHFNMLAVGEVKVLPKRCRVYGHRLSLVGVKLADDYLIVATNAKPDHALALYARRWEAETLFAALKSRGFNLEASHLRHDERVEKLLALLALAFAWAHLIGEWLHARTPIPLKKHGRLAKSLFRYGLDYLQFVLLNFRYHHTEFARCLMRLSALKVLSGT